MRRKLGLVVALALLASCGTRAATITYATLAGVAAVVAISPTETCDDHSECDHVWPVAKQGVFGTIAIGFGVAALVSAVITPDTKPPPPSVPARDLVKADQIRLLPAHGEQPRPGLSPR
jgi:hypothetical protein